MELTTLRASGGGNSDGALEKAKELHAKQLSQLRNEISEKKSIIDDLKQ